jgi:hypothetical protein
MGFLFPTAHQEAEVHFPQALPRPATFRPQGLVTLSAAYSLRAPAGFVSRRRRSWDSPFGAFSSRKVSAAFPRGRTHLPFHLSVFPPPERWAGPTGRGFWVSALPRVPGDQTGINSPTAGCSHGLRPSRACWNEPCHGSRRDSSHALCKPQPLGRSSPAPRSLNRLAPRPATKHGKPWNVVGTTLLGFLHRPEPTRSSGTISRAYCFASRRVVHRCRPPERSLGNNLALPQPLGLCLGCRRKTPPAFPSVAQHLRNRLQMAPVRKCCHLAASTFTGPDAGRIQCVATEDCDFYTYNR